jgi:hypothetical protein
MGSNKLREPNIRPLKRVRRPRVDPGGLVVIFRQVTKDEYPPLTILYHRIRRSFDQISWHGDRVIGNSCETWLKRRRRSEGGQARICRNYRLNRKRIGVEAGWKVAINSIFHAEDRFCTRCVRPTAGRAAGWGIRGELNRTTRRTPPKSCLHLWKSSKSTIRQTFRDRFSFQVVWETSGW